MPKTRNSHVSASSLRNFTFGVEDSLASTVGLLSGVASAGMGRSAVVITGLVLIFTEALSMGIGSFLSEMSVHQLTRHTDAPAKRTIHGALVMFFSYLVAGLIPLSPYTILEPSQALWFSILLSLIALFILGVINAYIAKIPMLYQGVRMLLLGGAVAISGIIVGYLLRLV